jgi:predicted nucleic acid-binding Zn ribbon protein
MSSISQEIEFLGLKDEETSCSSKETDNTTITELFRINLTETNVTNEQLQGEVKRKLQTKEDQVKGEKFKESDQDGSDNEANSPKLDTDPVVLFISEDKLTKCPEIQIRTNSKVNLTAIIDTGSEVNLISENALKVLSDTGQKLLILPVENV